MIGPAQLVKTPRGVETWLGKTADRLGLTPRGQNKEAATGRRLSG
jgi:hypothetical protein